MGYRELLKNYMRHLELVAGDNYMETAASEPVLSQRDLGENCAPWPQRSARDAYRGDDLGRVENFNHRLRVLINRHALSVERVAELCEVPVSTVRRWRTNPNSDNYQPMRESDFASFEAALNRWLESGA
jgi:hypothetical protein